MEYGKRKDLEIDALPGRGLQRAIGKNSHFDSDSMCVGYALYHKEYGVMQPHHHAEETVIITRAEKGWVAWGDDEHNLDHKAPLEEGMILHIPENEWHAFYYEEGGCVEIIFIYGDTKNCRPEDNKKEENNHAGNNERDS